MTGSHGVAVTGAGGFVGRAVRAVAEARGMTVRPIMRAAAPGVAGIGDIGPATDWRAALAGCRAVVHLAARVHHRNDASDTLALYRHVNTAGTLALAEQAAALGLTRFVFVSTVKVNGEMTLPGRPFTADDRPAPVDPYGLSKLEAELGLAEIAQRTGMEVVIIRPPLVYGPGVQANFRMLVHAAASGVPLPFAAIRNRRSLVAVDNLADLICHGLDHPAAPGVPLFASDGDALSTPALLRLIAASLDRPARLFPVPTPMLRAAATLAGRRGMVARLTQSLEVDGSETRRRLDWTPPLTIEAALAKAAAAGWA